MPEPTNLSRREFVTGAVLAAAAMQVPLGAMAQQQGAAPQAGNVELHWLDGAVPAISPGATWGVPWPKGALKKDQTFALKNDKGDAIPMQSWPTAYWPDGSLKWSAHSIGPGTGLSDKLVLSPGAVVDPKQPVSVTQTDSSIQIDTGVIKCTIAKRGGTIIQAIERDGKPILQNGHLVCSRQDNPDDIARREPFTGEIETATVEQSGPLRAVVKLEGKHRNAASGRTWLPFVVRLYFHSGGDAVRVVHTFIFDGDEQKDFISGLGVRFDAPMRDELHNRHVRFVGEGNGMWAEGIRGLTGLRRDPGAAFRNAQVAGTPTPPANTLPANVAPRMQYIPAWGDYTLAQLSADGFEIRKRTKEGYGWIKSAAGKRASGFGYVGGISGGVAFGMRDFWQKYPAQLDVRNAAGDSAQVTLWLYSPETRPMDLRFYHDGMGQDTYQKQYDGGLEITYEDYEKGFGSPVGVARTSEMMLWAVGATPTRQALTDMAAAVRTPPLLSCDPAHYVATKVFGGLFSLPDRSTPAKTRIEDQLDFLFKYYQDQREQRNWYGFWDYGDVMHTYDADRHVWRYDIGGFAWDNSELSPDLWLWFAFLRSGRADIFRFAEAMTRHTSEVDMYHLGKYRMLGSRHNVQHWGCSAKQCRISTAVYKRFYYFLTADERVGDILRELIDSDQTFMVLDPIRKIRPGAYNPDPHALSVGFGTDWGSLAAAWMTEWERTNDPKWRDKMLNGMKGIAAQPKGFFTGSALFDPATGAFQVSTNAQAEASHLSAVFGLVEMCAELINSVDVPEFEKAWLQYCELYNAPAAAQTAALGNGLGALNLGEAHSRLTAYAATRKKDPALAQRAWNEFFGGAAGYGVRPNLQTQRIEGPIVLNPVDEAPWVSTNATAQWGLAAIQCLAMVGDSLPAEIPAARRGRGEDVLALSDHNVGTLSDALARNGHKPSNARRVLKHYWGADGNADIASLDISRDAQNWLIENHAARHSKIILRHQSADSTTKLLVSFNAGGAVECVLMPSHRADRAAACISSQIGCAMGCDFCASTRNGLERDLAVGEIVEQFMHLRAEARRDSRRIASLVFMGMGEPMHNLDSVVAAIRLLATPGLGDMGYRAITVSTVGIVPGIERLTDENLGVHLALSLHAPDDATRDRLVPSNRRWPVAEIMNAAKHFQDRTGRPVNVEYCMLAGVNDSDEQARQLANLMNGFRAHVNLIPYNAVGVGLSGVTYQKPADERITGFANLLRDQKVVVHIRRTRGDDIAAACGQLRQHNSCP